MMDTFLIRRCIGIVLAVLLAVGIGFFCCDSLLKADEYEPTNEVVTEEADEPIGGAAADATISTVSFQLTQNGDITLTDGEMAIPEEEVPQASLVYQGPNKYLVLASVFVPVFVAAVIWGINELQKKRNSFYSFTSL